MGVIEYSMVGEKQIIATRVQNFFYVGNHYFLLYFV